MMIFEWIFGALAGAIGFVENVLPTAPGGSDPLANFMTYLGNGVAFAKGFANFPPIAALFICAGISLVVYGVLLAVKTFLWVYRKFPFNG